MTKSIDRAPAQLRPLGEADLPAVAAIYAHHVLNGIASFEETPPSIAELAERRRQVLARGDPWIAAVAPEDDSVLGYAYLSPYRTRSAYRFTTEDSIYLAPEAAGRGIGRSLLTALIAAAERRGYRQMVAAIGDSGNAASIGLHRALGFAMIGTLPAIGWKRGQWVDGVLMQRALGPGAAAPPEGLTPA